MLQSYKISHKQRVFLDYCVISIITDAERILLNRILADGEYNLFDKPMLNELRFIFLNDYMEDMAPVKLD